MTRRRLSLVLLAIALGLWIGFCLALLTPQKVRAECHPIPVTWYSPTGVAGCEVYGEGLASWWGGPGIARNDCVYPWTHCQPIVIRSLQTGRSISVTPRMYGDLYSGTPSQRLVDLDPVALKALGLWDLRAQGLFRVTVEPVGTLPDTAMRVPEQWQCAVATLGRGASFNAWLRHLP